MRGHDEPFPVRRPWLSASARAALIHTALGVAIGALAVAVMWRGWA